MLYRIWLTTLLARNRNPGCPHKVLATVNSYNTQGHRITKSSPHSNRPLWLSALVCYHFHSPTPLPSTKAIFKTMSLSTSLVAHSLYVSSHFDRPSTLMRANRHGYGRYFCLSLRWWRYFRGMEWLLPIQSTFLQGEHALFRLLECLRSHSQIW